MGITYHKRTQCRSYGGGTVVKVLSERPMDEEGVESVTSGLVIQYVWNSELLLLLQSNYRISLVIRRIIFLPKQSQRSRSIFKGGSRSLGLFRKGKIGIIAKFHRTDLVI